uniref:hypothetical protein n=1 Tax=Ruminococcus sp. TaxID=41978 RepID=UPI0025DDFDD1
MKHITQKIISLLASVVTAVSSLTLSCSTAFAEEQISTASTSSADNEAKAGGLLGDLMPDEFEQLAKDNEEASQKEYVIYSIDFDYSKENLIVDYTSESECTIFIGFYNDEGTQLYKSINKTATVGENQKMLVELPEMLPANYLVRTYLVGYLQEPLSKPCENREATKVVQDIIKKKPEEFDSDKVIRVSDDDDYSFVVTKNEFITVYSDDTKDTLVSIDDENGKMTFDNIDKFKSMAAGQDVLVYLPDDVLYFRIESIEQSGTTAVVTKQFLDYRDLLAFIKIDSTKFTGEVDASVDTSDYEDDSFFEIVDNVSKSEVNNENGNIRQPAPSIDFDRTFSKSFIFDLGKLTEKSKIDNLSIEASGKESLEITPSYNLKVYFNGFYDCYISSDFKIDFTFRLEGELKASLKLPSLKIGPPAINFSVVPTLNAYFRAGTEITFTKEWITKYSPEGREKKAKPLEFNAPNGYIEFEITIGLDAGINVVNKHLLRVSLEPELGIRYRIERDFTEKADYVRHDCTNCEMHSFTIFGRISTHINILGKDIFGNQNDDEVKPFEVDELKLEPVENELDFSVKEWHITNGQRYEGPCENTSHKIILNVYDYISSQKYSESAGKGGTVKDAKFYIKTSDSDFVLLTDPSGINITTNEKGKAEAWIKDDKLNDKNCIIMAQTEDGKSGQAYVGKEFDEDIKGPNSFEILVDDKGSNIVIPKTNIYDLAIFDKEYDDFYVVNHIRGDYYDAERGVIVNNINGSKIEIEVPSELRDEFEKHNDRLKYSTMLEYSTPYYNPMKRFGLTLSIDKNGVCDIEG